MASEFKGEAAAGAADSHVLATAALTRCIAAVALTGANLPDWISHGVCSQHCSAGGRERVSAISHARTMSRCAPLAPHSCSPAIDSAPVGAARAAQR